MKKNTYYHILYVSPRASDEDVKKAWRAQAARWHPDRHPRNRAQAQRMFILVNRAYTILKTRPQREAYNRHLLKMSSLRKQGSEKRRQHDSRFRANKNFFLTMKEIFWPFATNTEACHG